MRILVVDDHGETRELVARHLERAAHAVKSAESVAAARSLLIDDEFDLIVLDVMLPDANRELALGRRVTISGAMEVERRCSDVSRAAVPSGRRQRRTGMFHGGTRP